MTATAGALSAVSPSLIAQQLIDTRPSPTSELNRTLETGTPTAERTFDAFTSPVTGNVKAPPSTPYAGLASPSPSPPASQIKRVPSPAVTKDELVTDSPAIKLASPTRSKTLDVDDQQTPVKRPRRQDAIAEESPAAGTSSPKGARDIFSLSTDKQLSDLYKFVKEIGFGNWGSVWEVQQKQAEKATMAVKLVFRVKDDKTTPARVRSIWQEFKVIRSFKSDPHPNIIRFYDFIICPSYALVTMDIHHKLMPTNVPESEARGYFSGLLSGVDYLHSHGVTHNDIKPANILLSADDEPVIVDFGFANRWSLEQCHSESAFHTSLSWGTPEYLSPERAAQKLHDERLADIWSLGVTMYEVVVGRTPFEKDTTEEFITKEALKQYYERTLTGQFFGEYQISLAFEDLIRQMVDPSVYRRLPTCAKGLQHPFFSLRPPSVVPPSPSAMKIDPVPNLMTVAAEHAQQQRMVATGQQRVDSDRMFIVTEPTTKATVQQTAPLAVPKPFKNDNKRQHQTASPIPGTATADIGASPSPSKKKKAAAAPSKPKKELQVYQDKAIERSPSQASMNKSGSVKQTGLRPLLLRAESAQSVRPPVLRIDPTNATEVPCGPLTSTPKKSIGAPLTPSSRSTNRNSVYTPSKKGPLGSKVRDSKDLAEKKSPVGGKTPKALHDKENGYDSGYWQGRSPRKAARSPQKQPAAKKRTSDVASVFRALSPAPPALPPVATQPYIHAVEKPYKLSKQQRRPSIKSTKSTSGLSFTSLSSSFGLRSGRNRKEDKVDNSNKDVDDDYAMVERDGRVSNDGGSRVSGNFARSLYEGQDILHIRKPQSPEGDRQEVIQERIISPEQQRAHGEAVAARSMLSRSLSVSSGKRLQSPPVMTPPVPSPALSEERIKMSSPIAKIRRSMAPSFAPSRPASRNESRCESRQSEASMASSCSVEAGSEFTAEEATATFVPDIQVSRPHSVSSAALVRSCWSPETCQSETETVESHYSQSQASHAGYGQAHGFREGEDDDEEEHTMHASPVQAQYQPEIRRTSGVFQRAPRAESVYQSFICASPTIEVPVKAYDPHASRPPTSMSSTWSPSSRAMATPTPDILREYTDMSKFNAAQVAPFSLFPPPDDLRSLASPPPRPDTSASRRTIGKMKSFFGKLGFGSTRS